MEALQACGQHVDARVSSDLFDVLMKTPIRTSVPGSCSVVRKMLGGFCCQALVCHV